MDSLLLTAPAIEADLPPAPMYAFLRYVLAPAFPKRTPFFMPLPVSSERIWKNEKAREHFTDPKYKKMGIDARGQKMRLGTGLGCVVAIDEAKTKAIPSLEVPFCIIHGTDDEAVKLSGSEYMMSTAKTPDDEKELHPIEGSFHESLADPEVAEASMGHWIAFLKKRLEAR